MQTTTGSILSFKNGGTYFEQIKKKEKMWVWSISAKVGDLRRTITRKLWFNLAERNFQGENYDFDRTARLAINNKKTRIYMIYVLRLKP